jgi:exopolysaccharide biosynthesis WecB/TagA/CpsF family protein
MIDYGKKNLLGILIDAVDYEAALARILVAAESKNALSVSALAVHGVMTGVLDKSHCYRLNRLDLAVPDGQPVRWAVNLLHQIKLPDRVYGPTLMLATCEKAAQQHLPIYLYGSQADTLECLAHNLQQRFPDLIIAGMQPSKFRTLTSEEKESVANQIKESGAAITFVGLGCPRQEVWIYEYHDCLPMPLVAVGAAFDFHAGKLAQAPRWMQRQGLEWLFRLAHEPRRLWKRYILLNPLFIFLFLSQVLKLKHFNPQGCPPPTHEIRYG